MSVNRFENRDQAFADRLVMDFDSDISWRVPYKEIVKLQELCLKRGIPSAVIGSGGKGFHHYIFFKEEPLTDQLNSKIFSIQYSLKKYLNLQAADEPLFGKKNQMIRIPTSIYVRQVKKGDNYSYEVNGNFCRYIPDEDLMKGVEHIEQLLKEPGTKPEIPKQPLSIDDIISRIPDYKFKEKSNGTLNLDLNPGGVLAPTIEAVGLPCLQSVARESNPDHTKRIEIASWLKLQGYRDMAIAAFMRNCKWQNFDLQKTLNNLSSIKPRFPKCTYLKQFGECSKCSFRK